jgi:hypothetical protein
MSLLMSESWETLISINFNSVVWIYSSIWVAESFLNHRNCHDKRNYISNRSYHFLMTLSWNLFLGIFQCFWTNWIHFQFVIITKKTVRFMIDSWHLFIMWAIIFIPYIIFLIFIKCENRFSFFVRCAKLGSLNRKWRILFLSSLISLNSFVKDLKLLLTLKKFWSSNYTFNNFYQSRLSNTIRFSQTSLELRPKVQSRSMNINEKERHIRSIIHVEWVYPFPNIQLKQEVHPSQDEVSCKGIRPPGSRVWTNLSSF